MTMGNARVWLRTFYGAGENPVSGLDPGELYSVTGNQDRTLVLNDESLYNFGDDWRHLFRRIPEVLDSYVGPKDPVTRRRALHRAEAYEIDEQKDDDGVPDYDDEPPQFDIDQASITGCLWIQDRECAETGKVMLAYIDDKGFLIRLNRIRHAPNVSGLFEGARDLDSHLWSNAEYGDHCA